MWSVSLSTLRLYSKITQVHNFSLGIDIGQKAQTQVILDGWKLKILHSFPEVTLPRHPNRKNFLSNDDDNLADIVY
jgi:hypothetical protein